MQKGRLLTRGGASVSKYERVDYYVDERSFRCSNVSSGIGLCPITLCKLHFLSGRRYNLGDLAIFGPVSTVPEQIEADLKAVLHDKMMHSTPA